MEIRPNLVLVRKRGQPTNSYEPLFFGNEGNKHRDEFDRAAIDSQYEDVALFENLTPRMVVHPPVAASPAVKAVSEVKLPPLHDTATSEVKTPGPQASSATAAKPAAPKPHETKPHSSTPHKK